MEQVIEHALNAFLADNNMIHQIDSESLCRDIMNDLCNCEVHRLIPRQFGNTEEDDDNNGNNVDTHNAMRGIDSMNHHGVNTFFKYRMLINYLSNVIDNTYALIVKYSNVGGLLLNDESMAVLVATEVDMTSICPFSHEGGLFSSEVVMSVGHSTHMTMLDISKKALHRLSKTILQSEIQ